jgi:hypothetical protein
MTMNTTERLGKDGLSSFPLAVLVPVRAAKVAAPSRDQVGLRLAVPGVRPFPVAAHRVRAADQQQRAAPFLDALLAGQRHDLRHQPSAAGPALDTPAGFRLTPVIPE